MPSTIFIAGVSGGQTLVSGNVFSGNLVLPHQINLKVSASGIGPVFIALPPLGGGIATFNSGGVLSSGGLGDGWEMSPNQTYSVPRQRLSSGIETIRLVGPAASSGTRIIWDWQ